MREIEKIGLKQLMSINVEIFLKFRPVMAVHNY